VSAIEKMHTGGEGVHPQPNPSTLQEQPNNDAEAYRLFLHESCVAMISRQNSRTLSAERWAFDKQYLKCIVSLYIKGGLRYAGIGRRFKIQDE
jgi:hypothetical protein